MQNNSKLYVNSDWTFMGKGNVIVNSDIKTVKKTKKQAKPEKTT